MIWDAIVTFLLGAASALVSLLPNASSIGLQSVASPVIRGYTWANTFLPLSEALTAVGIFVGVYLALIGFAAVRELIRHIPFVGG